MKKRSFLGKNKFSIWLQAAILNFWKRLHLYEITQKSIHTNIPIPIFMLISIYLHIPGTGKNYSLKCIYKYDYHLKLQENEIFTTGTSCTILKYSENMFLFCAHLETLLLIGKNHISIWLLAAILKFVKKSIPWKIHYIDILERPNNERQICLTILSLYGELSLLTAFHKITAGSHLGFEFQKNLLNKSYIILPKEQFNHKRKIDTRFWKSWTSDGLNSPTTII